MTAAYEKTRALQRLYLTPDKLVKNENNPNKMSGRSFDLLVDNLKKTGLTDPVFVRPIGDGKYRIVGGHHRFDAAMYLQFPEIPVTVVDTPEFDEDMENFQLVRMNVIRGQLDPVAFIDLYKKASKKYSEELLQDLFGFADDKEFKALLAQTKATLPKELKKDFDKAVKEVKTMEGLTKVLNSLFARYGSTLNYNYMVFDYQGKESVWIRCKATDLKVLYTLAEQCTQAQVTVDAAIVRLFQHAVEDPAWLALLATLPKNLETLSTSPLPLVDVLNNVA